MNNNNDNKRSEGLWVGRMFKESGKNTVPQSKANFAHLYPAGHSEQDKNPFRALFSGEGNGPHNSEVEGNGFLQIFKQELSLTVGEKELAGLPQRYGSVASNATEDSLCDNPLVSETQFTVFNCHSETLDTSTFRLGRLDGRPFDYLAGQYITISAEINGQNYKRSYSLASTPTRPGYLELTVKRDPNGGVVSNWLNDSLKVGDTLDIKGPFGKFTCARAASPKILFLAAGSGIVPIMSMLRWLTDTQACADVAILLSFRTRYDIIFSDELNMIATRHSNIKLHITLTKEPLSYSQWPGLSGRICEKMIADCVPDVLERAVYLCGPDGFMVDNKQHLQNLGVPYCQLRFESFTVNASKTPEQADPQHSTVGRPTRNQTGCHRIRFAKSGKTVTADGAITLLDLAEKSGITINHECRAGNCGECMVKCLKGSIEMTGQAEIDDIDRKKGWVYACCAYPVSNAVFDV
jgi:glycine betaine catabolism B